TGYLLRGGLTREQVEALASEWLGNDLIQQHLVLGAGDLEKAGTRERLFHIPRVELNTEPRVESFDLETARDVLELSEQRLLALSPEEAGIILEYYSRPGTREKRAEFGLGGRATDVELEVIAQTWSEHCKHKIFNAEVEYTDEEAGTPPEHISSLFKTYIRGATARVRADKGADDICLSVFTDNAGVIRFDENWGLVLKVETHNSPSALDPYGGALTGIVGVNRDPFGTGRGAELLFNTDVFCFASPFYDQPLPPRLLHPRRIYEGVRLGVEHGGNKSGIPTINGSLSFHERFVGKPLVFCGTGGLLPAELAGRPGHEKWINPGDKVVMVGGRIGADGIHGATFSSLELNENSPVTAVQIGDPITQRKMFDFLLLARERNLYNAITDNGAGGLSSSVGEMAQMSGGAVLHLDRAPLKYPGLQPWEIFISEAQERMSLAVPPEKVEEFLRLSREMDVESTVLGEFTDSGFLQATFAGKTVALLDMEFLHEGLPPMRLKARWRPPASQPVSLPALDGAGLTGLLRRVLGRLNVCSKESVVRQYDHEVKGASVVKPLVGASDDGPSDAAVVRPVLDSFRGVALAHGICPRYSDLDTYHMSALAVDEAVRGLVAVGADPDNMAGLDNFCWCDPLPSPTNPEAEYKMAQLVRSVRALYDTCLAYGIPLISGKDSMKNDYVHSGVRISIPPTLLFTAAGLLEDVRQAVTMDAKAPGDLVYLLGDTRAELGGSEALEELGLNPPGALAGQVPRLTDPPAALRLYRALHGAIRSGLVRAAHDCSDGGLAVALAETAFAGALGLSLELGPLAAAEGLTALELLFSESPARLVVMIPPGYKEPFERAFAGLPCHLLGQVTAEPVLRARGGGELWLEAALADLKSSWQATLKDM
ncbi:MAG: AIR synthase-related protein, partial [Deltaproteobacteria bacterium]|nr:AIR synthase-related protein [Deltaproteobacteria bacterium]